MLRKFVSFLFINSIRYTTMATIKTSKLISSENAHLQSLAAENSAIKVTDTEITFPLSMLGRIIQGEGAGIGRRPWLIDLTDDIVEASMFCDVHDNVTMYIQFNDMEKGDQEITFEEQEDAADMVAYCVNGIEADRDGYVLVETPAGRDRDGNPEYEMEPYSMYDLLQTDLIGYSECLTIFTYYLIKEATEAKEQSLVQVAKAA